jgi:small subunit ribosomal protein S6
VKLLAEYKNEVLSMIYESTFITLQELQQEKIEELIAKIVKIVEALEGTVIKVQQLGKRKFAYSINRFREGSYICMEFSGNGEVVGSLERFLKVSDLVVRFLTIKVNKKKNVKESLQKPVLKTPETKHDESTPKQLSPA